MIDRKREVAKPQIVLLCLMACFKCSKDGYQAAECRTKSPAKKGDCLPGETLIKPSQSIKDIALKSAKVMEFCPSPKVRGVTPTSSEEEPGPLDSDFDDDHLVNELI